MNGYQLIVREGERHSNHVQCCKVDFTDVGGASSIRIADVRLAINCGLAKTGQKKKVEEGGIGSGLKVCGEQS